MALRKAGVNIFRLGLLASSAALLGASTAPYIDPASFSLPAFLGLMYPFLLLIHVILFIIYLLIRRKMKAFLLLIPALITIHLFLSCFGINYLNSRQANIANTLKIMTYNVHMFKAANDLNQSVQTQMFQLIKDEQPAIFCMQDFQANTNIVDSLKLVSNAGYFYNGPNNSTLFPTNSIATFSKYPIENTGFIKLSETSPGSQAIFTDINKDGKLIRVYNVHFESLGFKPEEYEEWKNADIIGKFEFLFKVKNKFSTAFTYRSQQVKLVKEHAATCPYPFIIAGDFNDTPSSYATNYTMRGMKNTFREKGTGYQVTFNGGLPDFQIDYIMVQPVFNVLDYKVIRKRLSDHYPVLTTINMD